MYNIAKHSLLIAVAFCGGVSSICADEFAAAREQVLNLGKLTTAPAMMDAEGFATEGNTKVIYFDGLPWKGNPTKVFAWVGMPENGGAKVPGVVLVHGGGGTAFKEWVERWNAQGFAAISIAVEGQTDQKPPKDSNSNRAHWKSHQWAGPKRVGIYGDSEETLEDQWMYHAVADTILANSLLRSLPQVDADKVGLMGISWGGVITSTVVGVDNRFSFAIPTYGCGHLSDAANQYGRSLGTNELYKQVWDPMQRLERATMPMLWLSWPGDEHFALDCQAACYRAAGGPRSLTLIPGLKHGHGPPRQIPDGYEFAKSVVEHGKPWCRQTDASVSNGTGRVSFSTEKTLDKAVLISTTDTGFTGDRKWKESPAELTNNGLSWVAMAKLPANTTSWFINAKSGELVVSSEYQESESQKTDDQNSPSEPPPRAAMSEAKPKSSRFPLMDKDQNDEITKEEYLKFYQATFDRKDKDRDGLLTADEFPHQSALKFGDADGDGKLSREEYPAIFDRQFDGLDKNKDGVITSDEI